MGRYVRRILNDWEDETDLDLTLVVRRAHHVEILREEFDYRVSVGANGTYDAVWYPWNAMRFEIAGAASAVHFYDPFAFTFPHRDFIARWREQAPIRRAMDRAGARATISRWSAAELARVFKRDADDFEIIYPVPDPFWMPVDQRRPSLYVLVVAGPEERKNLSTLVRAFARAFPRGECELVIVGNVGAKDAWMIDRSQIRHERVRADDAALRMLYSGALAVTVPSSAEGYGLMAVEAMACGAPVIASNASALPEACDGAAILVPPFDVDGWAFALERVVHDGTLRETMREQSLARTRRIDGSAPARLTLALIRRSLGTVR
jgi:glycosyltransferase involved in cell wall biosynthesis